MEHLLNQVLQVRAQVGQHRGHLALGNLLEKISAVVGAAVAVVMEMGGWVTGEATGERKSDLVNTQPTNINLATLVHCNHHAAPHRMVLPLKGRCPHVIS